MNTILAVTGLLFGVLANALPAGAHHSAVNFDSSKRITITGTVTSFEWANPHGRITLDADTVNSNPVARPQAWVIETDAPGKLIRQGWTKDTVKPGDKITVEISLARTGSYNGMARELTRVNGTALASLKR